MLNVKALWSSKSVATSHLITYQYIKGHLNLAHSCHFKKHPALHIQLHLFYSTAFTCNANCSKWGRQERTNCRCILACWGLDKSDWSSDGSLIHNHRPAVRNINTLKKMSWEHQSWKMCSCLGYKYFSNVLSIFHMCYWPLCSVNTVTNHYCQVNYTKNTSLCRVSIYFPFYVCSVK